MASLRALTRVAWVAALTATPCSARAQIPLSFRVGPYGELTSRPWLDPGAGARSVLTIASDGEVRLDFGVRRPHLTNSDDFLVGTTTGTVQYNLAGGYPQRQWGVLAGYQRVFGAEHGYEWFVGGSTATSHARGEHAQYEVTVGPRTIQGMRTHTVLRFKVILLRLPPFSGRGPRNSPLTVVPESVDAGGVPRNVRWNGGRGQDVDRLCRFSYVQMSRTPQLVYRPECDTLGVATLNQPLSPREAKHAGLSCGVKDAEPIIRGHINWFVVNQSGRLRWQGFSPGSFGDHDFDLFLEAPALVTRGNIDANRGLAELKGDPAIDSLIELEFNGDETARLFDLELGGRLWSPLVALPRLGADDPQYAAEDARADSLFRDRPAVVTGLLGLDGEHDFHTELHPVMALGVDVSHRQFDRAAHAWLVMIRNMGNEGECSAGQVPWVPRDANRYVLEIPWKAGADSVAIDVGGTRFGFIARRTVTLRIEIDRGRALRLVADLPRPVGKDSVAIAYGTLRMQWFDGGKAVANEAPRPRVYATRTQRRVSDKHDFQPVDLRDFPRTRRLCFTVGRAEPARLELPTSFRPQPAIADQATRATDVVDVPCPTRSPP